VVILQKQEVHPSKNIQYGLDLWARVREYDARSAAEDFMRVLTRKQKLKVQQVLAKQPTKSRVRGDNHSTDKLISSIGMLFLLIFTVKGTVVRIS